jgi:FtsP/CotA-like multicopper oxidase with cupredoxin domain
MTSSFSFRCGLAALLFGIVAVPAGAQSFRVQCPTSTITHPDTSPTQLVNSSEPAYTGPTTLSAASASTFQAPLAKVNGAIKCQQISGGDGYATMADGTQTYLFSFGPLSGIADIASGKPGTEFPSVFNTLYDPTAAAGPLLPGDPATTVAADPTLPLNAAQLASVASFYNGAIGQAKDIPYLESIYNISESGTTVTLTSNAALSFRVGDTIIVSNVPTAGYNGTFQVLALGPNLADPAIPPPARTGFPSGFSIQYTAAVAGLAASVGPELGAIGTLASTPTVDGHVDPRQIMDVGVMNGNIPAPLMAIDEDDEFFLTLTNVGMIMRPDLFEQHTVHFHGYPNASSFYDGVPDASVAINIGASFTYYYLAPDAGTYFWHCHITPPEHLQMGMVGQLYVRPRQDRVAVGSPLFAARQNQNLDLRTACVSANDILCSNPLPAVDTGAVAASTVSNGGTSGGYAYNDGDGSTAYDVEYPLQIHGFDPNFHFVGMTFNPEGFSDMKDKYFLLNGRSYPDTVTPGPLQTESADAVNHFSQPLPAIITMTQGQKALLRISDLDVQEFQTLASLGIPMKVIGYNAKLLRDQAGNNMYYTTNSITLGGGESLDVILDSTGVPKGTYYLYTPNLDHLSNDAENFGGLMTEVHVL